MEWETSAEIGQGNEDPLQTITQICRVRCQGRIGIGICVGIPLGEVIAKTADLQVELGFL